MSATYTPYLPGPWELLSEAEREELLYRELTRQTGGEPDSDHALELAGVDEPAPTDDELAAMVARVLSAEGGGGDGEGEALYQQLEGMTPSRVDVYLSSDWSRREVTRECDSS